MTSMQYGAEIGITFGVPPTAIGIISSFVVVVVSLAEVVAVVVLGVSLNVRDKNRGLTQNF